MNNNSSLQALPLTALLTEPPSSSLTFLRFTRYSVGPTIPVGSKREYRSAGERQQDKANTHSFDSRAQRRQGPVEG